MVEPLPSSSSQWPTKPIGPVVVNVNDWLGVSSLKDSIVKSNVILSKSKLLVPSGSNPNPKLVPVPA